MKMLEVVNRIPQIDSIILEEKDDFYILTISYEPRYGFGMINCGSSYEFDTKTYQFVTISDIDAWENWKDGDEFKPQTEIKLRFPEKTYFMFLEREKETETYLFCKKSFYDDRKELVRIDYRS